MARLSYRVETYRDGAWQSEGVFDDFQLARAQAGQFADKQGNKGIRVLAEADSGAYRECVYDPEQGIDGPPQAGGGDGGGGSDGAGGSGDKTASAPSHSRGQVVTAIAVLAVGALFLAFLLIVLFDPLG